MFDSGVGGLTVMKELLREVPDARVVYFGDTARVPYGNRTPEELTRFGEEIISFLISQGAEAIVVACNTSSATALPVLREKFKIPLIGTIEAGARMAVRMTRNGRIGLIATEATVRSRAYVTAVSQVLAKGILPQEPLRSAWKRGVQPIAVVRSQACPLFVPLVEAGLANSAEAKGIAKTYLAPLMEAGVDTVILGCTHYPYLNPILREILGPEVGLADPAVEMIAELKEVLKDLAHRDFPGHPACGETGSGPDPAGHAPAAGNAEGADAVPWRARFYVSGDPELFKQVGSTLLQGAIDEVFRVEW